MQTTPNSNRLHIGIFGKTNSGKSSLINAITGQQVAIVSDIKGTTTDPVSKPMEISPLGACVLIDTAGFDDDTKLGEERALKTNLVMEKTDLAILVFTEENIAREKEWYDTLKKNNIPVICVINKIDENAATDTLLNNIKNDIGVNPVLVSAKNKVGIEALKEAMVRAIPEDFDLPFITGSLVKEDDVVLLIMPQDIQAPKGRLILPQVQTIRELLDKKCVVVSATTDKMEQAIASLKNPPKLIITDSQVFKYVYEHKPEESMLTSFSVLFAAYKGDLDFYIEGAKAIDSLKESSKVLIAECCTHAPLEEDIGRVKIPNLLRRRFGEGLKVDVVSGTDFPTDLSDYDLIIQCGGCMFNRKYILSRINRAKAQKIPMTNYGVTIAHLTGILEKISLP